MSYQPSELVRWSWEHTPRCLSSVVAKALSRGPRVLGHEAFSHFALSCRCGAKHWLVLGHMPEPELLLCPLVVKCAKCRRLSPIFDVAKHGYDAELGHGCYSRRAEGVRVELPCTGCSATVFEVTANVSYQFEKADLEKGARRRVHNLFDVFYLGVKCRRCGQLKNVGDYECA